MISILSLFECIACSSSVSLEETKLTAVASWIFQVSDVLRSLMIFLKYRLILLRYSSVDRVSFLSPSLSYAM